MITMRKEGQDQRIPPLSSLLNFPLSDFHLDNFFSLEPRILLYNTGKLQANNENLKYHVINRKQLLHFFSLLWDM